MRYGVHVHSLAISTDGYILHDRTRSILTFLPTLQVRRKARLRDIHGSIASNSPRGTVPAACLPAFPCGWKPQMRSSCVPSYLMCLATCLLRDGRPTANRIAAVSAPPWTTVNVSGTTPCDPGTATACHARPCHPRAHARPSILFRPPDLTTPTTRLVCLSTCDLTGASPHGGLAGEQAGTE